jgi:hypothetical protein
MNKAEFILGDEAMTDPVTIGMLAASALTMASDEAFKGFAGEAVKDAYKALKEKISNWAGADVEALEKAPASTARQSVVAEAVDDQPADEQASVKSLVDALVAALKSEAGKSGGPIGLDVGKIEALQVKLAAITVTEGTGARFKEVKTTGTFEAGPINVGNSPGKTDR